MKIAGRDGLPMESYEKKNESSSTYPTKWPSWFSTTSWEVSEFFTEDDYREAIEMTYTPIPGGFTFVQKKPSIVLPAQVKARTIEIVRTREHEWTHFRQHISTQLGLFLHRLAGLREIAVVQFFHALNETGTKYELAPFRILLSRYAATQKRGSSEAVEKMTGWLAAYQCAEHVGDALWCRTMSMRDLKTAWEIVISAMRSTHYLSADGYGHRLETTRNIDDQSCPNGHITVQQLSEGFAKFREFVHIASGYSVEDALRYVAPTATGFHFGAAEYIHEILGIPFYHPLSGALHEVSLLCFLDPILSMEQDILNWEDIHPGFRFEKAVRNLTPHATADKPEDAYGQVLEAFGLSDGSFLQTSNRWLESVWQDYQSIDSLGNEMPSSLEDLGKLVQQYQKSTFIEAMRIRRDYPAIYFWPVSGPAQVRSQVQSLTRPPLIVNPDGIFLPHGAGRSLIVGIASVYHALSAHALDEIANSCSLSETMKFAKKASSIVPDWFTTSEVRGMLLENLGPCIEAHLDNLIGDV